MTQKFRILSDLHLEHGGFTIPYGEKDYTTVLILAGDICNFSKRMSFSGFFQDACDQFKHVILVPGNHEYYSSSLTVGVTKFLSLLNLDCMDRQLRMPKNLTVLNQDTMVFDDVAVIGATCWTSFRNGNPIIMNSARSMMNDYNYIRYGGADGYERRLTPEHVLQIYGNHSKYVFDQIAIEKAAGRKVIVVTHHAPSHESVHDIYRVEGDINELYANHFEYRIADTKPDYWIHGHIHMACEYKIEDTTVICNPRGYLGYESSENGFDPLKEIVL